MKVGKERYLTFAERKEIEKRYRAGERTIEIANGIGRSNSAVYEDLKRGCTGEVDENHRPKYCAETAQINAQKRISFRGNRSTLEKIALKKSNMAKTGVKSGAIKSEQCLRGLDLQEKRVRANLSQMMVAALLDVSLSTVAQWERDERIPRADKLPKLAKIFGCTIDALFEQKG